MDSIVPPTFLPEVNISSVDNTVVVRPQNIQINLKPGTFILLEAIADSNLKGASLVTLNIQTKDGSIPISVKSTSPLPINVADGELQQYSARVLKDGSFQLFPLKPAGERGEIKTEQNLQSSRLISATINSQKINDTVFHPLKIVPTIEKLINDIDFPAPLKQQVLSSLPPAEIQVVIKNIGEQGVSADAILNPIKNILVQMPAVAQHPQQLETLQQQLQQEISALVGQNFSAKVSSQPNILNNVVLDSPLGKILSDTPLKLPSETPLNMEVSEIKYPQISQEIPVLKNVVENLAKFFNAEQDIKINIDTFLQSIKPETNTTTNLLKIFAPLLSEPHSQELVNLMLQKIPGIKGNILQNIYSFYKAAINKQPIEWIGKEAVEQLSLTSNASEIINNIDTTLSSSVKDTPLWRIIEVPFFEGTKITSLQISLKKNKEEIEKKKNSKSGLRFMIETEFSKLGAFQFDGLSVAPERRLDLVIRTSKKQDEDFCLAIINLFKKSLYDLEYIGSIKINQRESFIKIDKEIQALPSGVYI